jgi:hypothetical protein
MSEEHLGTLFDNYTCGAVNEGTITLIVQFLLESLPHLLDVRLKNHLICQVVKEQHWTARVVNHL